MTPEHPLRVAVVTVGRSDFSILHPFLRVLEAAPDVDMGLWVGGAHFDPAAGPTIEDVRGTRLPIWAELPCTVFDKSPAGTARAMAEQMQGVATALEANPHPDLIVILGDRFEAIAVGQAIVAYNIPVAHISGGSVTEGAIDDVFRHCLSKIAAFHFCEVPDFARRIQQMGEAPGTIHTVGALGLDGVRAVPREPYAELARQFGFPDHFAPGYALATLHPETRSLQTTETMVSAMLKALRGTGLPIVLTYPNADPHADVIITAIEAEAAANPDVHLVKNFGIRWFYTAMEHAGLIVGNSSSGIIEAGSFRLPVVNIGDRQFGRYCEENVIHCAPEMAAISAALAQAVDPGTAKMLKGFRNPYGDGHATERILAALRDIDWTKDHARKGFAAVDPEFTGTMRSLP